MCWIDQQHSSNSENRIIDKQNYSSFRLLINLPPFQLGVFECFKASSLEVFDKIVDSDIIPITNDARLVRSEYSRKISFNSDASMHNVVWQKPDKYSVSWAEHVLSKLYNVFQTHTLHIDILPKSTGRGILTAEPFSVQVN